MPAFTPEQHAQEVNSELKEAVERLSKKARRKLLKAMAKNIKEIENNINEPPLRLDEQQDTEGCQYLTTREASPEVTTSTNPTAPTGVQQAPRTHQRVTRNNVPMQTKAIKRPEEPRQRSQ